MSEVKHTMGPWEVTYGQDWPWDIEISPNILTMRRCAYSSKSKNIDDVRNGIGFEGDERKAAITANAVQEARARLIAAAPELLQALSAIVNYDDDIPAWSPLLDHARAAIAKAECLT